MLMVIACARLHARGWGGARRGRPGVGLGAGCSLSGDDDEVQARRDEVRKRSAHWWAKGVGDRGGCHFVYL